MTRLTPEQQARREIDAMLISAGWLVQDRRRLNLHAALGIALCETDVERGFADYMLFVDGKALGVLEAKAAGTPLVGVAEQSETYARAALTDFQRWSDLLRSRLSLTATNAVFATCATLVPVHGSSSASVAPRLSALWSSNLTPCAGVSKSSRRSILRACGIARSML